jgi:NAD(P)H-quinone oxidoreductase subunit 5
LHAGVVNLGGFVLIRFAGLLEAAPSARWILVVSGLLTAVFAGMVMLTRISIKVRLAWSTVAQMGFMVLECGLGLYTIAALHIIGHSVYKANAFLSASSIVQDTRMRQIGGGAVASGLSLILAPVLAFALLQGLEQVLGGLAWPHWWTMVMAFAWAPLLWFQRSREIGAGLVIWRVGVAVAVLVALTMAAMGVHSLPLGLRDAPLETSGMIVAASFAAFYLMLALIQRAPASLTAWRRRAYAGFYMDEFFTRVALMLGASGWMPAPRSEFERAGDRVDPRSEAPERPSRGLK